MSITLYAVTRGGARITRVLLVAIMFTGTLMVIAPWEIWLYLNTDRILPLSSGDKESMLDGLTFALSTPTSEREISVATDVGALMENVRQEGLRANSLSDVLSIQFNQLRKSPVVMAKLYTLKMVRSWYATYTGRGESLMALVQSIYLVLVLIGSIFACRAGRTSKQAVMCFWLIAFYFWGMTTVVLSIVRYMVPAMGLLMVLIPGCLLYKPQSAVIRAPWTV